MLLRVFDFDRQSSYRGFAALVRSFHSRDVIPGPGVTMLRYGVTIFAERLGVAVGLRFSSGAAIAEIPRLITGSRSKRSHLECHRFASADAERRSIGSMNCGREIICLVLAENLHGG